MQAWEQFLREIEKDLGVETTQKWLRSLKTVHFDACNLYLEAKDTFQALWFEEHIRPKIRGRLVNNNHHPIKVHLTVVEESKTASKDKGLKKEKPAEAPSFSLAPDQLDPWATFEHFICSEPNLVPYKLLCELANKQLELSTFNPIYLYGSSGVGKTHLLMATANALTQQGLSVLYVRAETFTEHVVGAIRNGIMQEFRRAYRHADVLIVDDVHLFARRSATQEELFHTFNTLHTSRKQIILSANCAPLLLSHIEERLISRFEWGITLHLEKLAPAELRKLVQSRSKALKFPLSEDLVDFLVKTFQNNTKSLHRALDALILRSHLEESSQRRSVQKLSVEVAEKQLASLIEEEKQTAVTPQKIIRAVADVYGIRIDDILGKAQSHDCALPRQIAMHLCRSELKMPYIKIGETFSRDHSTVMSGVKQIQKKLEQQDKEIGSAVTEILRQLTL